MIKLILFLYLFFLFIHKALEREKNPANTIAEIISGGYHSQSERYLLCSLTSARESIAALDKSNKELLEALAIRHLDVSRITTETITMQQTHVTQTEKIYQLESSKNFHIYE